MLVPLYLLPLVVKSDVVLTILIFTFLLSMLAVGFNIVFGGAGQLTMFHAAAFGIGSYVTFLSMQHFGISFWLGFLVAVAIVVAGFDCDRLDLLQVPAARNSISRS